MSPAKFRNESGATAKYTTTRVLKRSPHFPPTGYAERYRTTSSLAIEVLGPEPSPLPSPVNGERRQDLPHNVLPCRPLGHSIVEPVSSSKICQRHDGQYQLIDCRLSWRQSCNARTRASRLWQETEMKNRRA